MKVKSLLLLFLSFVFSQTALAEGHEVKVIAHRGYWTAPGSAQNSIRSLVKADSVGCFGTEFDVWMTSDSVLVVDHDGVINGYTVQFTPAEIICAQKLKNGETIPTLEEYLTEAVRHPGIRLICEMKTADSRHQEREMARKICEMAKRFGVEDRIDYITFSKDGMDELKKYAHEGAKIYYLMGDYVPAQLKAMGAAGADYHIKAYQRNPGWIKELKELGLEINVWTVDDPEQMKWCIDNEVDYITTNYPERFMELQKGSGGGDCEAGGGGDAVGDSAEFVGHDAPE